MGMYVFPGKKLTIPVTFEVGEQQVSPTIATYVVRSSTGLIVEETAIPVDGTQTFAYVTLDSAPSLNTGEKFRQLRLEVSFTADNGIFEQDYVYFIVPDLFLSFDGTVARQILGVSIKEMPGSPDYYRAYIDLVTGPIGTEFYNALFGDSMTNAITARNLILYAACLNTLPSVQMNVFKSAQSETSQVTRFPVDFDSIRANIELKYTVYYSQIQLLDTSAIAPTLLVTDSPTDAITGA